MVPPEVGTHPNPLIHYVSGSHRKNLLSKISPTPPRCSDDNEISQPPFDAYFLYELTNSHHRTVKMSLPNVSADLVWEITRTCHRPSQFGRKKMHKQRHHSERGA